jgi:hypothetical protein
MHPTATDSSIPGYASGLPWVPRDDYLMRAHEGEGVLTRTQNEAWQGGDSRNGLVSSLLQDISDRLDSIDGHTERGADAGEDHGRLWKRVTRDGESLVTTAG